MKEFETGCLIIHGFAGSRREIDSLVTRLNENGLPTSVPVLAGHESSRRELARAKYTDWIQSVFAAYNDLEKQCNNVVVMGFSMGGLLGIQLCQAHKIKALVLINTPIYYLNLKRVFLNLGCDFRFYARKYLVSSTNPPPFAALIQFLILLHKTKSLLKDTKCTSLIFQTLDDDVIKPKSANHIYANISGHKTLKLYPTGGHLVLLTETGERIGEEIYGFLEGLKRLV
ncbi:esterase/lipase [Desulfosporosinus acidiphilus SJ4]|uniref:Esterase/lipase n=1 Tax=Desulfosporosinus acidiphilus (strain DSM 22704 / JCM 16185 / SJ4) TaxID=646529 RepID=I4D5Q8_DESAJ|nr:alpha/beta fold hydrolase [Desulfosporosinus acidiphilus]AFM41132.1 esterase/lipase [Desulfosporosinus acidiphilus SJ4]